MKLTRTRSLIISALVALFLVLAPGPSRAWGPEGHQMIMKIAIDLMPPGDRASLLDSHSLERLEYYLMQPDRLVDEKPEIYKDEEGPNHYVNIEKLQPADNSFEAFVKSLSNQSTANGRVIDRIKECQVQLASAARTGNGVAWLRWAGFLAHYVGDSHQPLHATSNYNGKLSGNRMDLPWGEGIDVHIRFEVGMVGEYARKIENRARDLATQFIGVSGGIQNEALRFESDPNLYLASFVWGTYGHVDAILDADKQATRSRRNRSSSRRYNRAMYEKTGELAAEQIARAAIALAAIWYDSSSSGKAKLSWKTGPAPELSTFFHKDGGFSTW